MEYVLRVLAAPEGGFYSAEDADSYLEHGKPEHGEGAFYVWDYKDIVNLLGEDVAKGACNLAGISFCPLRHSLILMRPLSLSLSLSLQCCITTKLSLTLSVCSIQPPLRSGAQWQLPCRLGPTGRVQRQEHPHTATHNRADSRHLQDVRRAGA